MAETKETKMALKKEKHTVKLIPGFLMGVEQNPRVYVYTSSFGDGSVLI